MEPKIGSEEMLLSVIIPTYNEENRILSSLQKTRKFLINEGYEYEIIVVDDGSQDNTVKIVREFSKQFDRVLLFQNIHNKGKGAAIRIGVFQARGLFILYVDADLSSPIREVRKFLLALNNGFDGAIASRYLPGAKITQIPPYRRLMSLVFTRLVRLLFLLKITDSQCGFKCFKKDVAKTIFNTQRIDGFCFEVEALLICKNRHFKIKEIPVQWSYAHGNSIKLFSPLKMLKELMLIKIYQIRGIL